MSRKNSATHLQNHTCQQPEETAYTVLSFVVGRNANVHMAHWWVGITECNSRNVPKSSLLNRLMISSRVSEDEEAGLIEWCLELIGEGSWCVPSRNRMCSSVLCKFQNSTLTIRPCRLNNDILRIFNCNNDSCSKLQFLPCLAKIYNINTLLNYFCWLLLVEPTYIQSKPFSATMLTQANLE